MSERKSFEQEFKDKMAEWQAKIDEIASKRERVDRQNLLEFERQLDLLNAKHQLAKEQLRKLQAAGGDDWDEIKSRLDGIWNEIENALDSASAKIERFL